ncbi:MAG: hypothetical protein FWG02_04895 [Holophagaceae bacterium]|nr:hypothetical protein [Holophagaceae bacterium]
MKCKPCGFRWVILISMLFAQHLIFAQDGVTSKSQDGHGKTNEKIEIIKDDPIARAKWFDEWFGPVTPDYLEYKMKVTDQEIQKWGHLIPGTANYQKYNLTLAADGIIRAGVPSKLWNNIGPWRGQSQTANSSIVDLNIVDTGRPTIILPHPTNPRMLYVGYAGGGLWRCSEADITSNYDWVWKSLTDGLPGGGTAGNLSIGSADFKPENPNTIYLALGDMMSGSSTAEGRGFFISSDGGDTWVRGGTLGDTTRVKTVLALQGNIVLVAGNRGLFRSVDGGMNFTRIQSGPLMDGTGTNYTGAPYPPMEMATCWDVIKLQDDSLVMTYQFVDSGYGVYGGGGVAFSTDDGLTWTEAEIGSGFPANGFGRIAIAASGLTMYGLYMTGDIPDNRNFPKALMKSIDGGRSWFYQASPTLFSLSGDGSQTRYNHMIAVDPSNADSVFVGTNLSLYRSQDGGLTFSQMTSWIAQGFQYTHADFHISAWAPSGQKTLFIGTDGGLSILRQPDISPIPFEGSNTLVQSNPSIIDHRRNRNISTQLVYNIGSTSATTPAGSRNRVIAGFQDLGTRLRTDNNVVEGTYNTVIGGDGFGCVIHPYIGNWMLGSLYYTRVYRSINDSSFSQSTSGIAEAGNSSATPFHTRIISTLADSTGNRVYTYTNNVPYVSDDFGASWSALPTAGNGWPTETIRNFGASNLRLGLIGAVFDVTVNLGAGIYHRGRVAISEDNGTTWRTITGLPGCLNSMSDITFDTADPNVIYVASVRPAIWNIGGAEGGLGANHIWKSTDLGYTWKAIDGSQTDSNGFPFGIPVHVVKVDPFDNNVVYAGTDVGLYRSSDQGNTWVRFGDGFPLVAVRDIYIAPDGSFMRVGTHGRGIWEMEGITENYTPRIISQSPTIHHGLPGTSTDFSVGAVGIPAPTYQWQESDNGGASWSNISGATNRIYSLTLYGRDNNKKLRVIVANSIGTATCDPITINVNAFDIDGSPGIDVFDLLKFMSMYGSTNPDHLLLADFNGDGKIDDADLAILLGAF